MKHFTLGVAAILVAAAVSGAAAQDLTAAVPKPGPRVELGAGGAWYVGVSQDAPIAFADTRATVRVSRGWDLEGSPPRHYDSLLTSVADMTQTLAVQVTRPSR